MKNSEFLKFSAFDLMSGYSKGEFIVSDVIETVLEYIEINERNLNALITPMYEEARSRAWMLDAALARGEDLGPLFGVPVVIKDNITTDGVRTTCGSRMLENWIPPFSAHVVKCLERAGAVVIGKANMDEFAMGSSTEYSAFGPTLNPWDLSKVPGGSSGGSAASVAAGYAPIALGSDTGGSIRQPAAFCGVYGLKPTYGLVSRYGLVAFASSLDQIGPFARDLKDLALVLQIISELDDCDATCVRKERPNYLEFLNESSLEGFKVGYLSDYKSLEIDEEVKKAVTEALKICQDAGAEIIEVELPISARYGLPCYYTIAPAEASSSLARFDGVRYGFSVEAEDLQELYQKSRGGGFGPEVKRRILIGTFVLSSSGYETYYLQAQKARQLVVKEFDEVFLKADVLLLPATPTLPFKRGEKILDPVKVYMADLFTIPVNLAGLPGLSMKVSSSSSGLPVGIQLVSKKFCEGDILKTASIIERAVGPATTIMGGDRK